MQTLTAAPMTQRTVAPRTRRLHPLAAMPGAEGSATASRAHHMRSIEICSIAEGPPHHTAASIIASAWRETKAERLAARLLQVQNAAQAERDEARRRAKQAELEKYTLPGVLHRVWPIVRECVAVMVVAVLTVLVSPPAFQALPGMFDVRTDSPPAEQTIAALAGAGVAVAAFTMVFIGLVLLYIFRFDWTLHLAHALYVCGLFGAPLALLLVRICEHWLGAPLDKLTWLFCVTNLTVPAVLVIQWPSMATRFELARRLYAAALAVLCAWLLASVPYPTAVAALLLLALLDVVLVSLPGAPVQRLDAAHAARKRAGEPQMPGLTFKHSGLELGLGDFIIYSAFCAHAVNGGVGPLCAVAAGIIAGLVLTMSHIALARRRTVVPALPLSVALGAILLAAERFAIRPLATELSVHHAFS